MAIHRRATAVFQSAVIRHSREHTSREATEPYLERLVRPTRGSRQALAAALAAPARAKLRPPTRRSPGCAMPSGQWRECGFAGTVGPGWPRGQGDPCHGTAAGRSGDDAGPPGGADRAAAFQASAPRSACAAPPTRRHRSKGKL